MTFLNHLDEEKIPCEATTAAKAINNWSAWILYILNKTCNALVSKRCQNDGFWLADCHTFACVINWFFTLLYFVPLSRLPAWVLKLYKMLFTWRLSPQFPKRSIKYSRTSISHLLRLRYKYLWEILCTNANQWLSITIRHNRGKQKLGNLSIIKAKLLWMTRLKKLVDQTETFSLKMFELNI